MEPNQTSKKPFPKDIGALWIKEGPKGKYFSMTIEIDGVKYSFVGFKNQFKTEGDNKPDYRIFPPTPREAAKDKPLDKFKAGLDDESDVPF